MPRAMAKKENHMGFMSKLLSFGSDKDLKRYYKIVDKINGLEPQFEKMTEEELRAQTDKFRERYANGESLDDMLPEPLPPCAKLPSAPWACVTLMYSSSAPWRCTRATLPR